MIHQTRSNGHLTADDLSPFDDPLLAPTLIPDDPPALVDLDLAAVRQAAIRLGIDLSQPRHQTAIAARRARARDLATASTRTAPQWFYKLRSAIMSAGNALLLGVMLLLSYALLPVVVLGLGYAEIQRVALGIALFDAPRANLMATVSIAAYMVLLTVRAGNLYQNPDQARPAFSLRLVLGQLAYTLGLARRWSPVQRTRVQTLDTAISRLSWLVIVLGTSGTLADELSGAAGAWYRAIWQILTESSLTVFLTLIGGVSLTAGLLAALDFAIVRAYGSWVKLIPQESADFLSVDSTTGLDAADQAELQYLLSLINKTQPKP